MNRNEKMTPMTDKLQQLEPLYREWNAKINVISRKDMDAFWMHHVQHSLSIAEYLKQTGEEEEFARASVLDLGTGGGFPGIPLAIAYPQARFTLCDSVGKKTLVAGEVAKALSLKNVEVVNARAESLGRDFDYVVSRAVAPLPDLLGWSWKHCLRGLICLKGGDITQEIADAMQRFRLPAGSIRVLSISSWLSDPWFEGKWIVHVQKNFAV